MDFKVLKHVKEKRTEWHEPDTELWEYSYYVAQKGNPHENGLGHRVTTMNGVHGVLVPTAPIYKLKKNQALVASLEADITNNKMDLGEGNIEQTFSDLASSFDSDAAKAVGQVVDRCAGSPAAKATGAASSIAPASPSPPGRSSAWSLMDDPSSRAAASSAAPAALEDDVPTAKARARPKAKATQAKTRSAPSSRRSEDDGLDAGMDGTGQVAPKRRPSAPVPSAPNPKRGRG
eukprot:1139651-Alexandrium_andersonii.AAC.1